MTIDKVAVGNRINLIRENLGLSMTEFGKRIDDTARSGTINNWVKGKNLPNNERLKRIADIGDVPVELLLYGEPHVYIDSVIRNNSNNIQYRLNLVEKTIDYFKENNISPYDNDQYILEVYMNYFQDHGNMLEDFDEEFISVGKLADEVKQYQTFREVFNRDVYSNLKFLLNTLILHRDDEEFKAHNNLKFEGENLNDNTRDKLIEQIEKILN